MLRGRIAGSASVGCKLKRGASASVAVISSGIGGGPWPLSSSGTVTNEAAGLLGVGQSSSNTNGSL
jgi:hypothetical protein